MNKDLFQKKLEKNLNKIYKNIKNSFDPDIPNIIKQEYYNVNTKKQAQRKKFPLVEYKIRNGKVYIDQTVKKLFIKLKDERLIHNLEIIRNSIKWAKQNNLKIPNTTIYIWISDRFPWNIESATKFPIFVYSRPFNINFPIFPDNTFYCMTIDKKYRGQCFNWDEVKQKIGEKCPINQKKEHRYYFKGAPTTKLTHKLRETLETKTYWDTKFTVKLDAWTNYEPMYKFCEYLYLLNLPGHYPWSNRLKYLFIMNSVVININISKIAFTNNGFIDYVDDKYISFIDYITDDKDSINYTYVYHYCHCDSDKTLLKKCKIKQKKEFNKLMKFLNTLFKDMEKNPDKYKKMIRNGKNKIKKLTNNRVSQYVYQCICNNADLGI